MIRWFIMKDIPFLEEFDKLDKETKGLIKRYDDNIYENKISNGKEDLLYQICEKLDSQKSVLKEFFQKEIFVCGSRLIMGFFYSEDLIKKNIPDDFLSWYIFRERQVKHNFLLQAKYCWIILNLDKSKHEYARKLIRFCKYLITIYLGNDWISSQNFLTNKLIIECVKIAQKCVHYFRDRTANQNLLKFSFLLLKHMLNYQNLYIFHEVSDILIEDIKYYDIKYKNELVSILADLYKKDSRDIKYYDRTENVLNKLIEIFKADTVLIKLLKDRIAKLYFNLAKSTNGLQSYFFAQTAAEKYQEIGAHKKKERALKFMAKIDPTAHMTKLSFTFDLSELTQEINELTKEFLKGNKTLEKISEFIGIPSIYSIVNAKKDQSSITDLFQTTIFSSGSSTRLSAADIESGKKKIFDYYQVFLNSYLLVKNQFYNSLIEQKIFTIDNLTIFFENHNIDEDLLLFLNEGLKYFISKQIHAALFILIPQIERIVKKIAEEKAGISIKKIVREGEQDKTLGDYFIDDKFILILGQDLNFYCLWFLADKTGFNLRNKVAHGLLKYSEVQNHLLIGLIEIIFLLISIF